MLFRLLEQGGAILINTGSDIKDTLNSGIWIFQTLIQNYRYLDLLRDHLIGKVKIKNLEWSIDRFHKKIKQGQLALVWIGGNKFINRGIYAVIEILSDVYTDYECDEDDPYDLSNEPYEPGPAVKIGIKYNFVNDCLLGSDLKQINGLEKLTILTLRQGTVFKVDKSEWHILRPIIERKVGHCI